MRKIQRLVAISNGIFNCGSSSLKFQLIATNLECIDADSDQRLARGQMERIGGVGMITL